MGTAELHRHDRSDPNCCGGLWGSSGGQVSNSFTGGVTLGNTRPGHNGTALVGPKFRTQEGSVKGLEFLHNFEKSPWSWPERFQPALLASRLTCPRIVKAIRASSYSCKNHCQ
ncbi:uncharacterized protein PGTG_15587 [Puccinia graminis f. sp. tritici CRL 75-36-700-3]|uniref:Uncharacterized protein n=1 Tax=Puccinia graminis f. sp. tritici (strain CRL 75-36-700-3 / race SCCL) TaxID=418459 RepID=E3KZ99_PUCGT|nr:uncharacterized protein PGTG_15587 [Puccinia graminis f. sp. tritici CRL 75-36-700-3]EFP89624.1 hypothetical protein PGTG_15587 [Puccinia graminis f. sp. tritici CRL 75-36-700-3]